MPGIHKRALAEQDLINIWLYTYSEWGEAQAGQYLDDLESAMALVAEQPLLCREREEFVPPVRIHSHAHHLIVYQALEGGITVIRVLHENMDVDAQLED